MHHWSLRDKLQIACIINQHSIGKLFQLILSILLQICVVNYTKRNPDQYHCSSFHSLIFHWFCYSLTLFNVSTTEPNSVGNFGLLWNNFSEKKRWVSLRAYPGIGGTQRQRHKEKGFLYCFRWCTTGILEAYFLRLCSVLSEADTSEYSIHD